jgi:hypothetical protein
MPELPDFVLDVDAVEGLQVRDVETTPCIMDMV